MKKEEIYVSKKDTDVTAKVVKRPNDTTVILEYLTGDKAGNTTSITVGTLKRYWKSSDKIKQEEIIPEKSTEEILGVDMDEVTKPYPEPKEKKYIPKPESVIEYEAKRTRARKGTDFDVPTDYEVFADLLASRDVAMKKVNKGYIAMPDSSKIKLLNCGVGILASEYVAEQFVKAGFTSRPCIEKGTPFRFDFTNEEDYNKMLDILSELTFEGGNE